MFRLADETTLDRIEGALYNAREFRSSMTSWWWNVFGLVFIVASMGFFLYARGTAPVQEVKKIEFQPTVWYSASRGIDADAYAGQRKPLEEHWTAGGAADAYAPV